jgi:Leucine-rich repeat (LRR) protein
MSTHPAPKTKFTGFKKQTSRWKPLTTLSSGKKKQLWNIKTKEEVIAQLGGDSVVEHRGGYRVGVATNPSRSCVELTEAGIRSADFPLSIYLQDNTRILNLNDNELTSIPKGISLLSDALEELHAVNNVISKLPDDLSHCSDILRVLDLSHNAFSSFPAPILTLKRLERLNLSHNSLSVLPDTVAAQWKELKYLGLKSNRLKSLPTEMVSCQSLQQIELGQNRFQSIPSCLYELGSLSILQISHNPLKSIDLNAMPGRWHRSLVECNLQFCHLDNLAPLNHDTFPHLLQLSLFGNPFMLNPELGALVRVTGQTAPPVLAYLRRLPPV